MRRSALLILLITALTAQRAPAQVTIPDDLDHPAADLVREILARGDYQVIERDTVLDDAFHARGDLLVVGAELRLEGRVDGSVAVIDGVFFLRPDGVVGGPIASLGGEVYLSGLATAGEVLSLPLELGARVERQGAGEYSVGIDSPPPPPLLDLPGIMGVSLPSYNRVDGLTLRYGAGLDLGRIRAGARLRAVAAYHTGRGDPGGTVALETPLAGDYWVVAEVGRATRTNERWIRGELDNSLSALFARSDVRNYYESDAVSLTVARRPAQPLIQGESFLGPFVTLHASRDRSLRAGDPWSLTGGGEWRGNPSIDEGTLVSLGAGLLGEWQGVASRLAGEAGVEWAPGLAGDFEFVQLEGDLRWEMVGLWGHLIAVDGHALGSFGSAGAPRQRWSFVGGPGTLPAEPVGLLRGDQLLFVHSSYTIPLRRLALPLVGAPGLQLLHSAGTAWQRGFRAPAWEQNLGLGLQFSLVGVAGFVNPAAESFDPTLSLSFSFPF